MDIKILIWHLNFLLSIVFIPYIFDIFALVLKFCEKGTKQLFHVYFQELFSYFWSIFLLSPYK